MKNEKKQEEKIIYLKNIIDDEMIKNIQNFTNNRNFIVNSGTELIF